MYKNVFAVLAVASIAAIATACASAGPAAPSGQTVVVEKVITPTPGAAAPKAGSLAINGAGATFPFPLYSRWFYDYAFVDTAAKINYQSIGSGGGIAQITAKTVDFGASDAILTDAQYAAAPGIQMFPTVAGAIVPSYNLKGDDGKVITAMIKFPYTAVADIYRGKIKKWNDPVLAQANPDLKLPAKDIIPVHRSDGSGTTFAFTDYLSKVSPEWKTVAGNATAVKWPVEGLGGKGNEGVAANVTQNEGAIGYVELAYAKQNALPYGVVQNTAGEYVAATSESIQAAMADFGTDMGDKLAVSIANAPSKTAYPIASYTYLLLYMDQTDCIKGKTIISFIKWALSDANADKSARSLDYISLPDAVKTQVTNKLNKITCNGKAF